MMPSKNQDTRSNKTTEPELVEQKTKQPKLPGFDWATLLDKPIVIEPEQIRDLLYKHGIYTVDDIRTKPGGVTGAFIEATGLTVGNLRRKVKELSHND